jgi:hypothetical protein
MRNVTPIEAASTESRLKLMKAAPDLRDLLFDVLEEIEGAIDVVDGGDDGPLPNWAMSLTERIKETLREAGVSLE